MTRIRYTDRAAFFLERLKARDNEAFHSLQGLVIELSVMPGIDNQTRFLKDFGSGTSTPVYIDDEWWIVYRVDMANGEEVLSIISIWTAASPPNLRL